MGTPTPFFSLLLLSLKWKNPFHLLLPSIVTAFCGTSEEVKVHSHLIPQTSWHHLALQIFLVVSSGDGGIKVSPRFLVFFFYVVELTKLKEKLLQVQYFYISFMILSLQFLSLYFRRCVMGWTFYYILITILQSISLCI